MRGDMRDKRHGAVAAGAFGALLMLLGAAEGGEVADAAVRAENLLAEENATGAVDAFDAAIDAFWSAVPLTFRRAALAETVESFGVYEARSGARYRNGETMVVYLEPVGFGWLAAGDRYKTDLETDLEIRSSGGLIFGRSEKFARIERESRSKTRDFYLRIDVALPQLKAGGYELLLTLRDGVTKKSATARLPFTVEE